MKPIPGRNPLRSSILVLSTVLGLQPMLSGCSGTRVQNLDQGQLQERKILDKAFLQWRQSLQSNDWNSVMGFLSTDSKRWLGDIAQSARRDDEAALRDKSFEDIVFILALRVDRRKDPSLDDRPPALLARLFESGSPVRRAFLNAELGLLQMHGETATLGLREAPRVPVFFFVTEADQWRLEWRKTLPLIMRGAERLSRPHGKDKVLQAIWLLRNWGDREVYPEDLSLRR